MEEVDVKRIACIVFAALLASSAMAFANETKSSQIPWMASFDHGGDLNFYGTVGLSYYGLSASAGPEFMINQFDAGGVPLSLGIMVRGVATFASYYGYNWISWGAAPAVSLHWGVDFGGPAKFDLYAALGLGIYGFSQAFLNYSTINFGFAFFSGIAWHFSDAIALIIDSGYVGWAYEYGIGLKLKL